MISLVQAINFFNKISRFKILILFFLTLIISAYSISSILFSIDPDGYTEAASKTNDLIDSYSFIEIFISFVIVLPLIETLVFQTLILKTLKKLTHRLGSNSWMPTLVGSSLLFSAYHGLGSENIYHSFLVIIPTLPGAFIFCFLAILELDRENGFPIMLVFVLHALYNFAVLTQMVPLI